MFTIKDYEFKDDFIPCGLTVRLTKCYKAQTEFFISIYERIHKEKGDIKEAEVTKIVNSLLYEDLELYDKWQNILIDTVYQFINFYYPIDRDIVSKGFTDKELIEAYDNIRAIGATKEKAKKKGLKR